MPPLRFALVLALTHCTPPPITEGPAPTVPSSDGPVAPSSAPPASSAPPPSPDPPFTRVASSLTRDRHYPADPPSQGLTRKPSAVVLFSPPPTMFTGHPSGLSPVEPVRLQPLVCSIQGELEVGARCGEIMPATATVAPTGGAPFRVTRTTGRFVDDGTDVAYPAPYRPACCSYKMCQGRTVPYLGSPTAADGRALVPTQTIMAVWPPDADVSLRAHISFVAYDAHIGPVPWNARGEPPALVQVVTIDGLRFVSATRGATQGLLFLETAAGWRDLGGMRSASEFYVIADSDVDDDGRHEVVVLARHANNYGLRVHVGGDPEPAYAFSCGNT